MIKNAIFAILMIALSTLLFAQKKTTIAPPDWSKNLSIYEVNVRQFTPSGTFREFAEHLPRLKEMGVGILWLMPIHPIGEVNRKGSLGSYYSVKDYLAVNPEMGTKQDFRELVKKAHELGMYIIIDWVANHTAWDNPLTKTNPDFYTKDSKGNFVPPVADWSDVIDLNFANPALHEYMIKALEFWVEEFNIDGYRCDVAGMVPMEFWNAARKRLDKIKPVFMLAEDESFTMHESAFDMTYAWDIHHIFNDIAKGKKSTKEIVNQIQKEQKLFHTNAYRMLFTSNHDENSWNGTEFERMGDGFFTFAVLTYTLPGMPLIYSGQEAGLNRRLPFFEKDTIQWNNHPAKEWYTKLNRLKKENRALWNGKLGGKLTFIQSNKNQVLAYTRIAGTDKVLTIANLSVVQQKVTLKGTIMAGKYIDLFTGEEFRASNAVTLDLKPWQYLVLVKQ